MQGKLVLIMIRKRLICQGQVCTTLNGTLITRWLLTIARGLTGQHQGVALKRSQTWELTNRPYQVQ